MGVLASIAPHYRSSHGAVWTYDCTGHLRLGSHCLGLFVLHSTEYHPAFQAWAAYVRFLREQDGHRSVALAGDRYARDVYELKVLTLNPTSVLPAPEAFYAAEPEAQLAFLEPPDQDMEFHAPSDAAACAILERLMQDCCDGALSPTAAPQQGIWEFSVKQLLEKAPLLTA